MNSSSRRSAASASAGLAHEGVDQAAFCAPKIVEGPDLALRADIGRGGGGEQALGAACPFDIGNRLQCIDLPLHRLVGGRLQPRIDRRVDPQPVRINVVVVAVGPVHQPLADMFGEMRRVAARFKLPLEVELDRPALQRRIAGFAQHAAPDHLRQHHVAPRGGAFDIEHRVVIAIALQHADQRRAFEHAQFRRRLVEIGARCHFDAECVVQEGHRVQVVFQDLFLGECMLDLQRGDGFLELAGDRALAPDFFRIQVARKLLGNGRSALHIAAQGAQQCAGGPIEVDTVMLVEAVVLGGDQRARHMRRDPVQRHPFAVEAAISRQPLAVDRHQHAGLFVAGLAQVGDAGRKRDQRDGVDA
jgi:hypothetical protein